MKRVLISLLLTLSFSVNADYYEYREHHEHHRHEYNRGYQGQYLIPNIVLPQLYIQPTYPIYPIVQQIQVPSYYREETIYDPNCYCYRVIPVPY